jgi:uncharacterized tellurite resistance protein B-like protein
MLRTLKAFFEDRIARVAIADDSANALPLAVAALLIEIAQSDQEHHADERMAIIGAVSRVCGIAENEMLALLEAAEDAAAESVSFYDFTSVINERFDRAQKFELLLALWRIAYADGRLDHYEEYYIRRLADLLHLSHSEFIRAKHQAAS